MLVFAGACGSQRVRRHVSATGGGLAWCARGPDDGAAAQSSSHASRCWEVPRKLGLMQLCSLTTMLLICGSLSDKKAASAP